MPTRISYTLFVSRTLPGGLVRRNDTGLLAHGVQRFGVGRQEAGELPCQLFVLGELGNLDVRAAVTEGAARRRRDAPIACTIRIDQILEVAEHPAAHDDCGDLAALECRRPSLAPGRDVATDTRGPGFDRCLEWLQALRYEDDLVVLHDSPAVLPIPSIEDVVLVADDCCLATGFVFDDLAR